MLVFSLIKQGTVSSSIVHVVSLYNEGISKFLEVFKIVYSSLSTFTLIGFSIMMILDVSLG